MLDYVVDRLRHTVAVPPPYVVRPEVAAFHRATPVVDLLVGTALFRREFVPRQHRGHVDLPRLQAGGVNLIGLSLATRFPDLRGTLSAPHFLSLGIAPQALGSSMATIEILAGRIGEWERRSGGHLRIVRSRADLDAILGSDAVPTRDPPLGPGTLPTRDPPLGPGTLPTRDPSLDPGTLPTQDPPLAPDGRVGAFLGVQGAHALDGEPTNLERLHRLGVRMLAPAHVMDNAYVGSGTGRHAGGLTPAGRDLIAEMERLGIVVDLAHMSSAGIRDALPLLRRPFVLSHTGFQERCRRTGWRHYSAATRNVSSDDARLVAEAGGVIGVTYATELLGGSRVQDVVDTIRFAIELAGAEHVALGSDLDGALRATFDVRGVSLITQGLLDAGLREADVRAVLGGNALRVLWAILPAA